MSDTTPSSGLALLPPIGQIGDSDNAHADVASFIQALVQESIEGRDGWVEVADRSITIYTYGADPRPDDDEIVIQDIQNAVQATTDVQTKEPPSAAIEAIEKGDPPICYWAGPQDLAITPPQLGGLGMATNQVAHWIDPATGQTNAPVPLSEDQADQLRDAISAGGIPVPDGMGGAKLRKLKPDWLVEINAQFVADFYQGIHDLYGKRSGRDEAVRANLLSTNILGWTLWLYEFDADAQKHIYREMSIRQMYIDPTVRDISLANYAGAEVFIDRDEATKLHPQIAAVIEAEAQIGMPVRADTNVTYGQAVDRNFRRPMVAMRIFWLRNQECPHTPEDAISRGLIEQREVPDEAAIAAMAPPAEPVEPGEGEGTGSGLAALTGDDLQAPNEQNQPGEDAQGEPDEPSVVDERQDGQTDGDRQGADAVEDGLGAGVEQPPGGGQGGVPAGGVSDDDAQPAEGGGSPAGVPAIPPQPLPTRIAHFVPGGEEEVDPSHPQWPTYRCIRQITMIGGRVVEDKECDFWDIPILHNVNRPIPQRPFGQGEPYVLWKIQKAKSRVLGSMVENVEFYGAPASSMSQSMADSLEERYEDVGILPGRTVIVEDTLYEKQNGQIHTIIPPPQMPDGLMKLYPILSREMDDISGYTEALQGQANADVTSGKMLDSMQSAGASIMGFKAARTADMFYRMARLELHSLVYRLDANDIRRVNRKYPLHIVEAIVQLAREEIEWDATVTVAAGTGTVLRQKKAQAAQDRQMGAISMQTYREQAGIDDRQEEQRMDAEAEKKAKQMQALAPPPPGAPPPPAAPPPQA